MTNIAGGEGTPPSEPSTRTVEPQADDEAEGGTVAAVQRVEWPDALPAAPRALTPVEGRTGGVQGEYTQGVQPAEVYTPNRLPTEVARTVMERAWWQGLSLGQAARLSTRSRSRVQTVYAAMEAKHGRRPLAGGALALVGAPAVSEPPSTAQTPATVYLARCDHRTPVDAARTTLGAAQRVVEARSLVRDGDLGGRWENLADAGYPLTWAYIAGTGDTADVLGAVEKLEVTDEKGQRP